MNSLQKMDNDAIMEELNARGYWTIDEKKKLDQWLNDKALANKEKTIKQGRKKGPRRGVKNQNIVDQNNSINDRWRKDLNVKIEDKRGQIERAFLTQPKKTIIKNLNKRIKIKKCLKNN